MDLKYRVETQAGAELNICYLFVYYGMASVLLKMSVSAPQFQWEEGQEGTPLHFLKMEWILINTLSSVGSHFSWGAFFVSILLPQKNPKNFWGKSSVNKKEMAS